MQLISLMLYVHPEQKIISVGNVLIKSESVLLKDIPTTLSSVVLKFHVSGVYPNKSIKSFPHPGK